MGFRCGIVGLLNVGKSTLFNALTQTAAAQAANYPFCTIEPNVGDVAVPDERLDKLAGIASSAQIIPTRLTFVDIAGHNGLRSISAHIGNDYRRVRIGVGHPGIKDLVHQHVLGDFAKSDRPWVEALCEIIAENAALLARGEDASFQNKVHLAMDAKGFFPPKQADPPGD